MISAFISENEMTGINTKEFIIVLFMSKYRTMFNYARMDFGLYYVTQLNQDFS